MLAGWWNASRFDSAMDLFFCMRKPSLLLSDGPPNLPFLGGEQKHGLTSRGQVCGQATGQDDALIPYAYSDSQSASAPHLQKRAGDIWPWSLEVATLRSLLELSGSCRNIFSPALTCQSRFFACRTCEHLTLDAGSDTELLDAGLEVLVTCRIF